ncbi:MAG TPA: 50S ribosomal protein L4 [Candidatus Pacebacteria bacterium]|nr:50S ribosomal protein L4 [Candidatus Paceibacterota bacterium]
MIKLDVYNVIEGKKDGDIELSNAVFGVEKNDALVHQVYVAQAANRRSGSAHTKIRSQRRGGGKKPWKQKGTGNARTGSIRNPIWRGGGVIFGPLNTRNFKKSINTKMKQKALLVVLSEKVRGGKVRIVDSLNIADNKTKVVANMIVGMGLDKSMVIGFSASESGSYVAARNINKVNAVETNQLNVFDMLNSDFLVLSKDSVEQLTNKYTA